ncbi:TonB-dependent receptor [Asticcacaulis machinosus]|uniref:TonB-dependent receptor n=1 Tax=Asticcacaulis machinosus TaxID=2984211 RepID=A0ABT5HGT1_9CAUL|nr:TonB-dependent receptor [Asticcacaulis machinosus]MDC7675442.1 TonB-dependent receptor [Asticcacaulis machinosus]
MKQTKRHRGGVSAMLRCGVSAVALSALMSPAFAQTPSETAATANATANASEDTTEVVVTAIRRSLRNAQAIKRDSDVIVDSITAEDIGALPDRSVTEALSRVPGVSINRFAAGVDPDHFSVEGSGVTVRGLNMTRSELNGRDVFSANNGRGLSFADVPSELMGGVDVFKNPSANMIEGGIAGTVNLRTRLPFDSKGQVISFSVEGSYGDFAKEWTPTYSGLYSNRWDTEVGQLGLLVNYVNSELTTRSDGAQISNYACRYRSADQSTTDGDGVGTPGVLINGLASGLVATSAVQCLDAGTEANTSDTANGMWFPRGAALRSQISERKREGYGLAAQWRSNDDTMLATFQYLRSEATQAWTEHAIEIATDNVSADGRDAFPVFGSDVTIDDQGRFTSGLISGIQGWRSDSNTTAPNNRTPVYGLQSNNIRRDQQQEYMTEDASFNFKWTPNDRWGVTFDAQRVKSTVDVIDNTIWGSSFQDAFIQINGDDIPTIRFQRPTLVNNAGQACPTVCPNGSGTAPQPYAAGANASYASPYNTFWRSAMDHFEQSEGEETAVRLDAQYLFEDNNFVKSVDFGVRWSEREQTTRFSQYNWGVLSEIWGGSAPGGPVWMDDTLVGGGTSSGMVEAFTFDNFMQGDIANPVGADGYLFYAGNMVKDYESYLNFANRVSTTWRPYRDANGAVITANAETCLDGTTRSANWDSAFDRCDTIAGTPFRLNEINPVVETNRAAYMMVQFRHEMDNGGKISGNVGLRYTKTDRTTSGYQAFPRSTFRTEAECAAPPVGQPVTGFCLLPLQTRNDLRNWSNGAISPIDGEVSYRYLLPSLNVRYQPNPEWVLRLGLSKTLTPPEMGLTRAYYNIAGLTVNDNREIITGNTTVGNPQLKPTQSNNIDLSAEWYFAPVGSVTLALFHKELSNVVSNGNERLNFTNNGATFSIPVTTPVNSADKGKIKGFELAYQQTYDFLPVPFDGLGVNANYSYIESDGVKQTTLSATDPDVAAGRVAIIDTSLLPLQGLSKHNANATVFYEKYGISARLAYNWRDDFLVTVRDVIVPFQPIMQKASGQLDGSFFYNVTPQVKIGVQGVNLTNEVTKTLAVIGTKPNGELITAGRSWFMNDRRVTFVIRGTF